MESLQEMKSGTGPVSLLRKRKWHSLGGGGESSSSRVRENGDQLAGGSRTKDPGKDATSSEILSDLEERPPQQVATAPLQAEGRPPTRATLVAHGRPPTGAPVEAQGRPPTAEAEWEINFDTLPPVPATWKIMKWIPSDKSGLTLPPKEMFREMENCIKRHNLPGYYG